ncbi:MAG TPA: type I DNA topoisomerase [Anaerolineae bacterium]|nr:type I DNA topoisomerase [Anaerolineae bacterium]HQK13296.1 type I DNA topoisomerase [Anaerolineae bacterium]
MTESLKIEAYCMKCREKREMVQPVPVFTVKGQPAVEGVCPVCGTKMFMMGRTPLHENVTPPTPAELKSAGKLVIVESPTKARTVGRFLGKGYTVKASVGHVRDLLRSQLSVDVENDFAPKYRIPNEKRAVVKELSKIVQRAEAVYLATDPDREGEAIAWHLSEVLNLPPRQTHRVVFHEITKEAVDEAFANPRDINMDLVNAQQARRILDRLVGYNLSPLLWRKVRSRLSAGRVQSVALRLIVEREREIEAFVPVEYWTLDAELASQASAGARKRPTFKARLARINGEEVSLHSEAEVTPLLEALERAIYIVSKVKEGQRTRKPSAPYTTSTLQQEGSRKLGFTARRTMQIAQQLYEGIDVGGGELVGLITYMRTDSTNIAQSAQDEARRFIADTYGAEFLPPTPPVYKTRAKGAQEAHEAIRPTSVLRTPDGIKAHLTSEQYRLYDLIWRRFVASQMEAAVYDTLSVEILAGTETDKPYLFRASGSTLRFPGFLVVYEEAAAENNNEEQAEKAQQLPPLRVDELLDLIRLWPEQHFTQPPPRYSDASLIKTLEEYGIGRPSTYATILSTIEQRGYVRREARRYFPTETGFLVNDMLVENFPDLINVDFTARMESDLDNIAEGTQDWVTLVRDFYGPFQQTLARAEETIPVVEQVEYVGRDCPECGAPLIVRWGRYGKFIGCSNFPTCRYTEPWLERIGVKCPRCADGDIVEKRTRKSRIFYGCSNWPTCEFTTWKRPLPAPCPDCGGLLVIARKDTAQCLSCEKEFALESVETEPQTEAMTS